MIKYCSIVAKGVLGLSITILATCCTAIKYNFDNTLAAFHKSVNKREKLALRSGKEVIKNFYGLSEDGGYDSGQLVITSVSKRKYEFRKAGSWRNYHISRINRQKYETVRSEIYDENGNLVFDELLLRKVGNTEWRLFQLQQLKTDSILGKILISDGYYLSGSKHCHLEWMQPDYQEKMGFIYKRGIFLPERCSYFNEDGNPITLEEYNLSRVLWIENVGRMSKKNN